MKIPVGELVETILACPVCAATLRFSPGEQRTICTRCERDWPVQDGRVRFASAPPDLVREHQRPAEQWTPWRRRNHAFFQQQLGAPDPRAHILDLGCGQAEFRDLFEHARYLTLDLFPYPAVDVLADIEAPLPIRDTCTDVVILSNVLEHIRRPGTLLRECRRVLRPGGRLLATVPFILGTHQAPYDYLRPTDYLLASLLPECGFADVRITRLGDIDDVYRLVKRYYAFTLSRGLAVPPPGGPARSRGRLLRLWLRLLLTGQRALDNAVTRLYRAHASQHGQESFCEGFGVVARRADDDDRAAGSNHPTAAPARIAPHRHDALCGCL